MIFLLWLINCSIAECFWEKFSAVLNDLMFTSISHLYILMKTSCVTSLVLCKQLHARLSGPELRQFAILLRRWHTDLPFTEFCQKVFELYGPERKYLLAGNSIILSI